MALGERVRNGGESRDQMIADTAVRFLRDPKIKVPGEIGRVVNGQTLEIVKSSAERPAAVERIDLTRSR